MTRAGAPDPVLVARLRAQLLTERSASDPVSVVERILAVQAQDGRGFRLAVRARSTVEAASALDRALTDDRSLVVDWLGRGTLHLVATDDRHWLHALLAPQITTATKRRLQQEGVDPAMAERGVALVARSLREDGPQSRAELRQRLDAIGVRTEGQALVHLLGAATTQGHVLRGPVAGGEQLFADPLTWLGPPPPLPDRDVLLAELARRYLVGHGPACDRDLAYWTGLTLGDARTGLAGVHHLVEHGDGLVSLRAAEPGDTALPEPVLLGPFDPLLHGWVSRQRVLGEDLGVVTSNGIFRPVALVSGRAPAVWRLAGGTLTWEVREGWSITKRAEQALQRDSDAVRAYLAA